MLRNEAVALLIGEPFRLQLMTQDESLGVAMKFTSVLAAAETFIEELAGLELVKEQLGNTWTFQLHEDVSYPSEIIAWI
jgi:hypothetical protein